MKKYSVLIVCFLLGIVFFVLAQFEQYDAIWVDHRLYKANTATLYIVGVLFIVSGIVNYWIKQKTDIVFSTWVGFTASVLVYFLVRYLRFPLNLGTYAQDVISMISIAIYLSPMVYFWVSGGWRNNITKKITKVFYVGILELVASVWWASFLTGNLNVFNDLGMMLRDIRWWSLLLFVVAFFYLEHHNSIVVKKLKHRGGKGTF